MKSINVSNAINGRKALAKVLSGLLLVAMSGFGQVIIPEGTKVRVQLDQAISSATAEQGQTVNLTVTDAVTLHNVTVIGEGARATGTVTEAHEKRRMGRSGKLDFSIDRVKAADGQWVPLRYAVTRRSGESHAVRTGILTAGVAAVFWPAAPVMLLWKGKDITINKGVVFDVYTDNNQTVSAPSSLPSRTVVFDGQGPSLAPQSAAPVPAAVSVTSSIGGADIEVDGSFVGNTPTMVQLAAGVHHVTVRSGMKTWERTVQVSAGSTVSLNVAFY